MRFLPHHLILLIFITVSSIALSQDLVDSSGASTLPVNDEPAAEEVVTVGPDSQKEDIESPEVEDLKKELEQAKQQVIEDQGQQAQALADFQSNYLKELTELVNRLQVVQEKVEPGLREGQLQNLYLEINEVWRRSAELTLGELTSHEEWDLLEINQKNQLRDSNFKILLGAGRTRARLLQQWYSTHSESPYDSLNDYFKDLLIEARLIPYRPLAFFREQLGEYREALGGGINGLVQIGTELFRILLLLFIPIIVWRTLKRIHTSLENRRQRLIRERSFSPQAIRQAHWIQRLNPFVPWIGALLALELANSLIQGTRIEELQEIFPYIQLLVFYQLTKIFLSTVVEAISQSGWLSSGQSGVSQTHIEKSARTISGFYFIGIGVLYATDSIVRRALIYNLVSDSFYWIGLILVLVTVWTWREEISGGAQKRLPQKLQPLINFLMRPPYVILGASFVAILLLSGALIETLTQWALQREFGKKLFAQFYRKKLESKVGTESTVSKKLPQDYLEHFDSRSVPEESVRVEVQKPLQIQITDWIQGWQREEEEENAMALVGSKGQGKTSLIEPLLQQFTDLKIIETSIVEKIISPELVNNHFGDLLGVDLNAGAEGLREVGENQKVLVVVDEAQNLFLAQRSGFEGFKAFLDLLNYPTKNVFWLCVFNKFSWAYLNSVVGGDSYFRVIHQLPRWSDNDIYELIRRRNEASGYQMMFDPILYSMRSQQGAGVADVFQRFSGLIWEQSKGNPRVALEVWKTCLTPVGDQLLKVGLPKRIELSEAPRISDEEAFTYAALIRHENLTSDEVKAVTHFPESTVRRALKAGLDKAVIYRSPHGRYRVHPLYQNALVSYLVGKNFLYE